MQPLQQLYLDKFQGSRHTLKPAGLSETAAPCDFKHAGCFTLELNQTVYALFDSGIGVSYGERGIVAEWSSIAEYDRRYYVIVNFKCGMAPVLRCHLSTVEPPRFLSEFILIQGSKGFR